MPEKFKTSAKYRNIKETVENYLSRVMGIHVLLVYVEKRGIPMRMVYLQSRWSGWLPVYCLRDRNLKGLSEGIHNPEEPTSWGTGATLHQSAQNWIIPRWERPVDSLEGPLWGEWNAAIKGLQYKWEYDKVTDITMDTAKEALQMELYKKTELVTFI